MTCFYRLVVSPSVLALSACAPSSIEELLEQPDPIELRKPSAETEPQSETGAARQQGASGESIALRQYYQRVLNDQLTRGLLRTDGGGSDTPYSADTLVRNFERIAFFNEYEQGRVNLRRWAEPVRIEARFGASVPSDIRARDEAALRAYAARLGRVTGHPVRMGGGAPNFHVFFVSEDDRAQAVQEIKALEPGIDSATLRLLDELPPQIFCLVVAFNPVGRKSTYTRAVAIIRTEQPDLMRLSCIHEEVAQGLGLANDTFEARPSIFNDDDEFALLTSHDEKLLRLLYHPRLKINMTARDALPIVRQIADELVAEPPQI